MKKENDNKLTLGYCRYMKDRQYRNFVTCKSLLESELSRLSTLTEEQLTKSDLLVLITRNFDYMRALNLYNYYKDEVTKLLTSEVKAKDDEGR